MSTLGPQIILVIDNGRHALFKPFVERYQVFEQWGDALDAARTLGYEDPFVAGINQAVGMMNTYRCGDVDTYRCGDVDIGIIALLLRGA